MSRQRFEPTWPFLLVLAGLFILSATSPRAWQREMRARSGGSPGLGAEPFSLRTWPDSPTTSGAARRPAAFWGPVAGAARIAAAGGDRAVRLDPEPSQTIQRIREFEIVRPAEKVAGRPIDFDRSGPQLDVAALPSRGPTMAGGGLCETEDESSRDASEPSESTWLPLPSCVGRTPPVDGSPWDEGVLPVERPLVSWVQGDAMKEARLAAWREPRALFDHLERVAWECRTGAWAREVARLVRRLGRAACEGSKETTSILEQLSQLAVEGEQVAAKLGEGRTARQVRRARHALGRRLDLWAAVIVPGRPLAALGPSPQPDPRRLLHCLAGIDAVTGDSAAGRAWREYLAVDALEQVAREPDATEENYRRALARAVLQRLTEVSMTARQQEFVSSGPLVELESELPYWAAEPVDLAALLRHIEEYEATRFRSDARRVAEDARRLAASPLDEHQQLARLLATHYRNANLRVAVTEELLNRLVPEPEPELERVRDTVLGKPVRGRSVNRANAAVHFIPDPNRLRIALEVDGRVTAITSSSRGPVTFYNDSRSTYRALKEMELGTWGIRVWPAEVAVNNQMRLRSLETELDGVPLVGLLAQGIARSQHDQKQPQAMREVMWKVASRAKRRIDQEAESRLARLSEMLDHRVFKPLAEMALEPTMISAQTTDRRMAMRMRLATDDQLAGSTPRPRAPSDSLVSVQVHESAANNVIEQMELDGRTLTLAELQKRVAEKLNSPAMLAAGTVEDDVTITFAEKDAVAVQFDDGLVVIRLSIARLSKPPRRWRDFQVRAFYRPEVCGRSALLVRDGVIHLVGEGLNLRSQIALRGVFAKTFHKERPWVLVPERITSNPQLADLAITQLTVEDGWLGIALGPARRGTDAIVARREVQTQNYGSSQ